MGVNGELLRLIGSPSRDGSGTPGIRRRLLLPGLSFVLAIIGFAAYVRLSWTFPADSDGASQALQAWALSHGNPLLRGWTLGDVSYYTTELPQYMLVELLHGLNQGVIHVAAAMTYTLAIALAALLATGRAAGRAAVLGACIAAGIMLAPQPAIGVNLLLGSPDHFGTSVPVLLAWLLLDRARPRWGAPAAIAVLGWAAVADSLVELVAFAPLVLVCVLRVVHAAVRDRAVSLSARRLEIALAAGAVAAAAAARGVLRLIPALGGFSAPAPASPVATLHHILHHNLPVVGQGLLALFGADFIGYPASPWLVLHLAGVTLAAAGAAAALWRFFRDRDLVSQLLLAGIVINLLVFLASTKVAGVPTIREADVVLPLSAALAGRQLAPRIAALPRTAAAPLGAVLGLAAVGYAAGLAHEIAPAVPPTQIQRLTAWLEAHHLDSGLSGYWESNVVTLTSGGTVRIRLVGTGGGTLTAADFESAAAWYDPARAAANFVVLGSTDSLPGFTDRAAVLATFGKPAQTYHTDGYTVLVWPHANLLTRLRPAGG